MTTPDESTASRREFLHTTALAAVPLAAGSTAGAAGGGAAATEPVKPEHGYPYRIAFGCWINDMRREALPLQQWPAPHLDEVTVSSVLAAMDVQAEAGFNYLDAWGLFATYGYPPDITSAFTDPDRAGRVKFLIEQARKRGITVLFGMGLFSWGYDQILRTDPEVQGRSKDGKPLDHVMCGASEKAWGYVEKILDGALSNFDFGGIHLESADLGWCACPKCGGKDGAVGYNARLNTRAADTIKRKWPGKLVTCIPINWLGGSGRTHFDAAEQDRIIELSSHVDAFMDQGWSGTFIPDDQRKDFSRRLKCAYGTSGGLWVYHCGRWDRLSYFLPYPSRAAAAIRRHYEDGVRACMFYQGPVVNPAVELNIAVGGRILSDTRRSTDEALGQVIDHYYRPRRPGAGKQLADLFLRAENAYFGRWDPRLFSAGGRAIPGELHLTDLLSTVPGPARYLLEPLLDAGGRREYSAQLLAILQDLAGLHGKFDDDGRLERIQKALTITLTILESIRTAKRES